MTYNNSRLNSGLYTMNPKGDSREQIRAKALSQLGASTTVRKVVKKEKGQSSENLLIILHVDDEPSARALTEAALPTSEYKVLTAESVNEAIDHLRRVSVVSLVLLDIIMPEQDGFVLLKFLQANIRLRGIPVVMVSGMAQNEDVLKAYAMGAIGYIVKPYSLPLLLDKIQFTIKSQQKSILLVSGELIILNILKNTFERKRCRTISVSSSLEAMRSLAENQIDAVISDLTLVDGTGPDLLAQIRENYPSIPFFFLDDALIKIQEEIVISSGANGILRRPLNSSDVCRKVTNSVPE